MKNLTGNLKNEDKLMLLSDDEFKKSQGITQAEYARLRGVTRQSIFKHIKNGKITLLSNGNIDPEKADKQLAESLDPAFTNQKELNTGTQSEIGAKFVKAKTKEKHFQASLAELTYKQKIRELVSAKEVEAAAFNMARRVRDNMLNIPDRIVAQVISLFGLDVSSENINKGRGIIENEIEKALQGI